MARSIGGHAGSTCILRRRSYGSVLAGGLTLPWVRERGKRLKPRYAMHVCRAGRRRFSSRLPFTGLTAFPLRPAIRGSQRTKPPLRRNFQCNGIAIVRCRQSVDSSQ